MQLYSQVLTRQQQEDMLILFNNPEDTRKYVIAAFEMLFDKREVRADKKHGTV